MENKSKLNIILLVIIIILLALGLTYFFFNNFKQLPSEINKPIELVKQEDDKLILQLDNGKERILQDVLGEDDVPLGAGPTENQSGDSRFYIFDKLYKDINYYGVYVYYYVGMDNGFYYLLINKKNGNQVSLVSDKIIISPDKQKVVSYNKDLESGFTTNGFDILNLREDGNFRKEYSLEPTDWGPSSAKWINNSEIEFEKTPVRGEIMGVVKYKLETDNGGNNTWIEVK